MNQKGIRGLLIVAGLWLFQMKTLNADQEQQKESVSCQENAGLNEMRPLFTTHVVEVYGHFDMALNGSFSVPNDNSFAGKLLNYLKKNYSFSELMRFYDIKDALIKFFMALCDTAHRVEHGTAIAPSRANALVEAADVDKVLGLCRRDASAELGIIFDATMFDKQEAQNPELMPILLTQYYSVFKESLTHFWTTADLAKLKTFFTHPVYNKVQAKGGLIVLFLRMIQPVNVSIDTFIVDVLSGLAPTVNQFETFLAGAH